jgi:hypothetical protein
MGDHVAYSTSDRLFCSIGGSLAAAHELLQQAWYGNDLLNVE